MYLPAHVQENDLEEILDFIATYNFAIIVSQHENLPFATHLPFLAEQRREKLFLLGHIAKANPQWTSFEGQQVMAIFQGPQAYISPSLYNKKLNVPTWNYMAVHAYGNAKIIKDRQATFELLEKQMEFHEKEYLEQWAVLPTEYKNGLQNGMLAFEIEVTDLQAGYKLSQNKKKEEQKRIAEKLRTNLDSNIAAIGKKMLKRLGNSTT